MLIFDNYKSINKIYDINIIGYQVVKIETIRTNPTRIIQHKNC